MAAATIVFTLSLSSSNALAEKSTVTQITEEEEKEPVTLFFSYPKVSGSGSIVAAEKEEEIPAFSEEEPEAALVLAETLPNETAVKVQDKEQADLQDKEQADLQDEEQTNLDVAGQTSCEQYAVQKVVDISLQQPKEYTDAEKEIIARVVFAEARGECFDGQVAVAQVVINRYESGKYGATVKRIAYRKNQFAVGKRYSDTCMKAVEYAIENMPYPADMYYFRVSKNKHWRNFVYYNRIGNHSFYRGKDNSRAD